SRPVVRGDDGARSQMLHSDLLEFHVEPAFEHIGEREPFVVPVQLFDVRPFRLDAYHLRGELAAGEIADPEVANKRPWRCELELSFVGMTYVSVEYEWVPPVGAEANLTRLCEVTAYGALFRRGDEGAAPSSRGANHDWKLSCMATTGPSEASNPLPT